MKKAFFLFLFIFSTLFCFAQKTDIAKPNLSWINIDNAVSKKSKGWRIIYNCEVVKFHIDIYDRWGKLLFKSDNVDASHSSLSAQELPYTAYINWGYSKLPEGAYVYTIKVNFKSDGKASEHQYTGTVSYLK